MKMTPLTLVAVCGAALATGAQAGDEAMNHGSGQAELKMMDTDHDGSVSADEHAAHAKKMFEMMDQDRDGILTAQELGAAHENMPGGKPMKPASTAMMMIKQFDADGDGTISAAEHDAGARKMFDKMDKDHNGRLSAAELQAGHEKMMTAEDQ